MAINDKSVMNAISNSDKLEISISDNEPTCLNIPSAEIFPFSP